APFLIARSIVSFVIDALRAASSAMRRRELPAGSAPPRAATMISFAILEKTFPLAFAAASRPFCFHCAPMAVGEVAPLAREGEGSGAQPGTTVIGQKVPAPVASQPASCA